MKQLTIFIVVCFLSLCTYSRTYIQHGYIKEKSSDTHKGGRLRGVKIKVKNRDAVFFSDNDGSFTLDGLDKFFSFEEITHKDYKLVDDEDLVWRRETTSEPIKILMVSPESLYEEAKRYYEPMLAELAKNNSKLKIDNDKLLESLKKTSERLAKIDFDELSDIDKTIRECLLKGEFRKADSLILSKGSIEERMAYGNKAVLSIVNDFKILSDNALIVYNIDKSIEYLENIVAIDPDNIPVLLELGNLYCQYKSDVNAGQVYINQAIFFAKKKENESPTLLAESYSYLSTSYSYNRNYSECINAIRKCLFLYNVPNIPEIGKDTEMRIDLTNTGSYPMTTSKDSSIVKSAYSMSRIIYGLHGNHRLAYNIDELVDSLFVNFDDTESDVAKFLADAVISFQMGHYDDVIEKTDLLWQEMKKYEYSEGHVILSFILAGSYVEKCMFDSSYYYTNKIINHYRRKKRDYYDQYYISAWAVKIKALCLEGKFDEALNCVAVVENELDLNSLPYRDVVSMIYNNKGIAYLGKGEWENSIVELLKSSTIMSELNAPISQIHVLLNVNLSIAYENINDLEKARRYIYRAFSQAKTLFKEIGYEHYLFYGLVEQMYNLEVKSNMYKEALETAICAYNCLDDNKEEYRNRVYDCYAMAKKSKKYKKQKEYKELVNMYKEFIETNSQ